MALELNTPDPDGLAEAVHVLRDWQRDDAPIQLHPGDLGWYWNYGPQAMADALRLWRRNGHLLAIGFLDGPDVARVTVAPEAWRDDELAQQIADDVSDPRRGVLPAGKAAVESPDGTRLQEVLTEVGWQVGEPWSPLRRDLAEPAEQTLLRVEVVEAGRESAFTAVHRSAWASERFTDEKWQAMAAGVPFEDGRCLLGYDENDLAVAGVTVWGAGPGRPGLLEPMGVAAEHRGRGFGAAICVAAAAALRDMGSSSAMVCTTSSNVGAVATYQAAGYELLTERLDRSRES